MSASNLSLPIKFPNERDNKLNWTGLVGSANALALSQLAARHQEPLLIITATNHQAHQLAADIAFFTEENLPIMHFPDWEILPYDHFSPHEDIISQRLKILSQLPHQQRSITIGAISTLLHRFLPTTYLQQHAFNLTINDQLNLSILQQQLTHAGYYHVNEVMRHGEFAVRGAIIDIFPMGSHQPFRLELFDDQIDTMRYFDPETQRSSQTVNHIELLPAREYPLTEEAITQFRQAWRQRFTGNPTAAPLYQQISHGEAAPGIEYYLPLFYASLSNFFAYCPSNTRVVIMGDIDHAIDQFHLEVENRYEQLRYDQTRPLCPPKDILLSKHEFYQAIKAHSQIKITTTPTTNSHHDLPLVTVNPRAKQPLQALQQFISSFQTQHGRILFCAESDGRREILLDLLKRIDCHPPVTADWASFINSNHDLAVTVGGLEQGLLLTDPPLALITETQLLGEQVQQRRLRKRHSVDPGTMIRNLTELAVDDLVVHIEHGIGRYLGLQTITTNDYQAEYLTLVYAGGDKIYVPVSSLHLISRYSASNQQAALQKLGSKQWQRNKQKALQKAHDIAAELLDIYSRRQASQGFAFEPPHADYEKFCQAFPFETTPDQQTAIDDVIVDMTAARSMDRLVCGDVGFGKTEVAMRAAFLATQNNKQVAVLVPTTLLANQHLQNFQDRFADWPINIAGLSRLRTAKEQQQTLNSLAAGKIDIIIGTHKLLSDQVKFKDLGLLIVDEEQRFGVKQKEKIKSLRSNVDILTLTATPIPRTLNMALIGIRDLSMITTPPLRRLSVKTFVHEFNHTLIREAILRESLRGGQVYFLHNEVSTIHSVAEQLKDKIPEARITVAHGQMRERELEKVMSDFYHQQYNVLVCSTIIESGIDIPSANTIIINKANHFGLAQLHQLRGRVGRSHHQAYAYLLTPPPRSLTSDAKKRLNAIAELDDLGVGFNLANHDLEIRGTGELLGDEQSGHIQAIGFTLYMELIEEAVNALKHGKALPTSLEPLHHGPDIKLNHSALLPETYVHDVHTRLTLYKRLTQCQHQDDVQHFKAELIDRFGPLPDASQQLLDVQLLKLRCTKIGIKQIELGSQFGYVHFNSKPSIDPSQLITLIQKFPKQYQLQGNERLRFAVTAITSDQPQQKLQQVNALLDTLQA